MKQGKQWISWLCVLLSLAICTACAGGSVTDGGPSDEAAVRKVAVDFFDAIFEGDLDKMQTFLSEDEMQEGLHLVDMLKQMGEVSDYFTEEQLHSLITAYFGKSAYELGEVQVIDDTATVRCKLQLPDINEDEVPTMMTDYMTSRGLSREDFLAALRDEQSAAALIYDAALYTLESCDKTMEGGVLLSLEKTDGTWYIHGADDMDD